VQVFIAKYPFHNLCCPNEMDVSLRNLSYCPFDKIISVASLPHAGFMQEVLCRVQTGSRFRFLSLTFLTC
jgi:hypothetical protein